MLRTVVVGVVFSVASSALAGPAEDANAAVDRWVAAYSANDIEALAAAYTPTAVLLGTTSPVISEGTAGIREYFKDTPGSNLRNVIVERRTTVLGEDAAVVSGFYDFYRADHSTTPRPARFTMVVVRSEGRWAIAQHHSSPRAAARQ